MEMKKKEKKYKDELRENNKLKERVGDLQGKLQKAVKYLDTYKQKEKQWKSASYRGSANSMSSKWIIIMKKVSDRRDVLQIKFRWSDQNL